MRNLKAFLAVAFFSASIACFAQDHVRFIVTGDSRWADGHPRPGDENGVNAVALRSLSKAILAEKPNVLLLTGDLIWAKTDDEETSQLKTFIDIMKPVYDSGIKVLTIPGNHDTHAPNADAEWRQAFSGEFADPDNGPAGGKDLSFYYKTGNCLFVGIDEFVNGDKGACSVDQAWLDSVLQKNPATHVFAFAHKLAFFAGHHDDGFNKEPEVRNTMMQSLSDAGCHMVLFGHDHFYDHELALKDGWPESRAIHQVIVGTAGAPFVTGAVAAQTPTDGDWKLTHLGHDEGAIGYAVVDVVGNHVSVVYKSEKTPGDFETTDSFSYDQAPNK